MSIDRPKKMDSRAPPKSGQLPNLLESAFLVVHHSGVHDHPFQFCYLHVYTCTLVNDFSDLKLHQPWLSTRLCENRFKFGEKNLVKIVCLYLEEEKTHI